MKFKYLIILILLAVFFSSCKSKKQVAQSQTKKIYPKVVHKNKEEVVVKNIDKKEVKSTIFNSTEDYIAFFKDAAIEEMKLFKIPASITLAQGILESSSGNSELTKRSNNHFGIKCHKGWEGDHTLHDDDEKGECFRVYKDPTTSYRDHSLFLTSRSRYSNLFSLEPGDYIGWAKGLSEAGYATDRRYPAKLIGLIEKFELHKYDTQVLGKSFDVNTKTQEKNLILTNTRVTQNNSEIHIVDTGETLFSISKRYRISLDELQKLNKLTSSNIYVGQEIKLKENIKTTKNKTHNVTKGDTLYSISKYYGISVNELKKINNLNSNEISIGQVLSIEK